MIAAAGCSRLAILTPYVAELNQRIKSSFEEDGFQVVLIKGMGILRNLDIGLVTPDEIAAFAREALQGVHADALFLSCTNFRAMEARKQLMPLGIPIFTSNLATLQAVLQIIG